MKNLQDEYDEIEPFFDLGGHRPHQPTSQPEDLPPQQRSEEVKLKGLFTEFL